MMGAKARIGISTNDDCNCPSTKSGTKGKPQRQSEFEHERGEAVNCDGTSEVRGRNVCDLAESTYKSRQ